MSVTYEIGASSPEQAERLNALLATRPVDAPVLVAVVDPTLEVGHVRRAEGGE